MTIKYIIHSTYEQLVDEGHVVDFNLTDEKGRAVGIAANFARTAYTMSERDESELWGRKGFDTREDAQAEVDRKDAEAGYTVRNQPTRDGIQYGAGQSAQSAGTLAECKALSEKGIANTRKRYEKKYGAK